MNSESSISNTTALVQSNNKDKKRLLIILSIAAVLIILAMFAAFIIAIAVSRNSEIILSDKAKEQILENDNIQVVSNIQKEPVAISTNNDADESESDTAETYQSKAQYLAATLPNNWTIKEYFDVKGMAQAIDSLGVKYSGLTGFEIINEDSDVIFSIRGATGIGGGGGCSEVIQFEDTQASYIQTIVSDTAEIGFGPTNVIKISGPYYSEISFLGLRMRRLDNSIYFAMNNEPIGYNTACGINAQFVMIDALTFTIEDGDSQYTANVYAPKLNTDINYQEETLLKLDAVLNSLKLVN